MKTVYVIGIGMGKKDLITEQAQNIINSCDILLATSRISEIFPSALCQPLDKTFNTIENYASDTIGLLVSGDAGFFSISKRLIEKFGHIYNIEIVNGINCLQYFCGKLKIPYNDLPVVSLHGRRTNILGKISYNKKIFALTGGEHKVHTICELLASNGLGHVLVTAGENLSYSNERIISGTADELRNLVFNDLSVMIIENPAPADIYKNLTDKDFLRGSVPITKEDIRNIVLAKLGVKPDETVYDIGGGTGAVSVCLARKAFNGIVYSIERHEPAVELIKENRQKHGTYNLQVIHGSAPDALEPLPAPDAVFIGGAGGNLHTILSSVNSKNPKARVVLTSITLQTLQEVLSLTGYNPKVTCINTSHSNRMGNYDMMLAQNPIYIIELEPVS